MIYLGDVVREDPQEVPVARDEVEPKVHELQGGLQRGLGGLAPQRLGAPLPRRFGVRGVAGEFTHEGGDFRHLLLHLHVAGPRGGARGGGNGGGPAGGGAPARGVGGVGEPFQQAQGVEQVAVAEARLHHATQHLCTCAQFSKGKEGEKEAIIARS